MNPITTVIVLLVESNILCGGDVASTCYQKKKIEAKAEFRER